MDAELLRGLVAKWRSQADSAMRSSGTWSGDQMADRVAWMADELEAALSGAQGQGWRPIESAPRDGAAVLLWWPDRCENCPANPCGMAAGWMEDGEWVSGKLQYGQSIFFRHPPTHWQPLPAAPAQPDGVE